MNIPDSLLFQMSPITSLGFLEYTYAGIYFLCLFFIWLVYFYSTPTHKEIPSLEYREALLPHSEDERFEMLLLHYIKDRLQKNFS